MISSVQSIDNLTLNLTQEIHVRASLDATFAALLEEIGQRNETHDGKPLPMKIEARPGGRWYRDLGDDNGHFWGTVQAIKRPIPGERRDGKRHRRLTERKNKCAPFASQAPR